MWKCPNCGEQIEDGFDSCWKCAGVAEETAVRQAKPKKPLEQFEVVCILIAVLPGVVFFALGRSQGPEDSAFRIAAIIAGWVIGLGGYAGIKIYQRSKTRGQR
jgi:hypothetical protein